MSLLRGARWSLPIALAIMTGCAGEIGGKPMDDEPGLTTGGSGGGTGGGKPGTGGGAGNTSTGGTGGSVGGGTGGGSVEVPAECADKIIPGRSPLRRITRFEYSNTVRDVLYDTTKPGSKLPSEVLANTSDLFGNNADSQATSSSLVEAYSNVAAEIAGRATAPAVLKQLDTCASTTATATEACARKVIEGITARAFRRTVAPAEVDELLVLHKANATPGFANGIATVIEAVLQSPDFLYRLEWGVKDAAHPDVARPTGEEMATRLAYTLWGTAPDDKLRAAGKAGELDTKEGVRARAATMLDDPRSHDVVRYFFDKLLPLESLTDLTRDSTRYKTFTPLIGSYMREETQQFLENEIFKNGATWKSILTAPYTYVNEPLAKYYGIPGITGMAFQKAPVNTAQRKGALLTGGVMTGTITTNESNPVLRGSFMVNKILCRKIVLPVDPDILAKVKIPEVNGKTARERFSAHSSDALCRGCHQNLDPLGFALENFDAVGLWRDTDTGSTIDASGTVPGVEGSFKNASELIDLLADNEETHACFASHWLDFAYGRLLDADDNTTDGCVSARIKKTFKDYNYDVKKLLVELTQTDAFLYMPAVKE